MSKHCVKNVVFNPTDKASQTSISVNKDHDLVYTDKCKSSVISSRIFKHAVIFDTQDAFGYPQFNLFPQVITVRIEGDMITILLPVINFALPNNIHLPYPPQITGPTPPPINAPIPGGFLYVNKGLIPSHLRTLSPTGLTFPVAGANSSTNYEYHFLNDGNILLTAPGGLAITTGGAQTVQGIAITYILTKPLTKCPPKNFLIGDDYVNFAEAPLRRLLANQIGDIYNSNMYNGKIVALWNQQGLNNDGVNYSADCMTRVGYANNCDVSFTSSPKRTIVAPNFMSQWQGGISINPTSQNNIVFNNLRIANETAPPTPLIDLFPLYIGYSNNNGDNYATYRLDPVIGNDSLTYYSRGDNVGIFDDFGNYWISIQTWNPLISTALIGAMILVSSDGGQTFTPIYTVPVGNRHDSTRFAFGPDGQGGYVMWFTYSDILTVEANLGYFSVTGNGVANISGPTILSLGYLSTDTFYPWFPNLAVDKNGVLIANVWDISTRYTQYARFFTLVLPEGTKNIDTGNPLILGPYLNSVNNLSASAQAVPGIGSIYIANSINVRGQNPIVQQGIAYDNHRKVLYSLNLRYKDTPNVVNGAPRAVLPPETQNMVLGLSISTNFGQTWSDEIRINKHPLGNIAKGNITYDPISHQVLITWYDSSEDAVNNQKLKYYGTVINNNTLDCIVSKLGPVLESPPSNNLSSIDSNNFKKDHSKNIEKFKYLYDNYENF